MREKWGNKFNMVRAGNEKADQLAQEGTKKETPPLYSRLVDKETEIGVYHKGQWVDSSICKHLTQIKNSNYAEIKKKGSVKALLTQRESHGRWPSQLHTNPTSRMTPILEQPTSSGPNAASSTNTPKTAGEEDAGMKQSKRALLSGRNSQCPHSRDSHQTKSLLWPFS